MDVPSTVTTALDDRPVEGRRCLEAGAGVGNTTVGLLDAGASHVYAITNDREHAMTTREQATAESDRLAVLEADLRAIPLPDESVDFVTAHGLCNVLDLAALSTVADELRRVAAPGCHLVVDDYDSLPETAAVRDLFAVENAAAELATGRPALTFYPSSFLRDLFVGESWTFERERTLLDPVPWTASHLSAHADAATLFAANCPDDVGERLAERAERLATEIGSESTGRMYSLAFRLPA
ncbi:unknown [Halorubrum sp. DM2]|uniref:class I SAM-dependent methyltransferase n=1 Tax=Halorubrum sp. DM2 TaxID=2527867 RepID=UPI0024B825E0|nr:class I SAM-dependent methyltransferase [Halorubrum sp. DM2]VTT86220.1 unknown [Halorubrum sp. DM2]